MCMCMCLCEVQARSEVVAINSFRLNLSQQQQQQLHIRRCHLPFASNLCRCNGFSHFGNSYWESNSSKNRQQ